jgi:hypothetical protein
VQVHKGGGVGVAGGRLEKRGGQGNEDLLGFPRAPVVQAAE